MSLVTTARLILGESARHRLSTKAVLPEPTGPAMPMRNARVGCVDKGLLHLEQKITLGKRQRNCRLTGEQFAIGPYFVGFWINLDFRSGAVVDHVALSDRSAVLDGDGRGAQMERAEASALEGCLRSEEETGGSRGASEATEHAPVQDWLRRWD